MQLRHHDRYDYSPIFERPQFDWPNGKRLAFYVALNVEHFNFGSGLRAYSDDTGTAARTYAILPGAIMVCGSGYGASST